MTDAVHEGSKVFSYSYVPKSMLVAGVTGPTLGGEAFTVTNTYETYRDLRTRGAERYRFDEHQLNRLGYELLGRGRVDDAIAAFELNVEAYPEAWNPHDSLGEAYRAAGRRAESLASYRRSLELNPDNASAAKAIEELTKP